ncbi:MAG: hypothetical protein JXM71_12000, partial [Spirochaetales bacterium]|nr:hypothetical protein [Spirochaetales bacterium]
MRPRSGEYSTKVQDNVERLRNDIIRVSQSIHAHPELGLHEHWACGFLVQEARDKGFTVETPVAGLGTAFLATYSSGKPGPTIGF